MASTLQTGDQFIVSRNNGTYKTTIDNIKEFIGSGGSEVIVSETAPDPADYPAGTGGVLTEGTLWWDSTEGDLFVLYDDNGSLIWVDATNHSNSDDRDVIISENEPVADFIGQLWVDTSECPPTLNVWDGDCDGGGGSWKPIEGGSSAGLVQLGVAIISSGDPDNYVGSVLTATGGEGISSAGTVIDPSYSWTRDNVTIPSVRGTTVTADVAGTYEVTATVVDSNTGETSSKTADILISVLPGVINQPTVLAPADGAGSGVTRDIVTDEITAVEGSGIEVCETELIENVDNTTDAPNVILTFPSAQGFDCFERGDVVQDKSWTLNKIIYSPSGGSSSGKGYMKYMTVNGSPVIKPEWAYLCSVADSSPGTDVYFFDSDLTNSWEIATSTAPVPPYTIDFTLLPFDERPKISDGLEVFAYQTNSSSRMKVEFIFTDDQGNEQTEVVDDLSSSTHAYIPQTSLDAIEKSVKVISKDDSDPYTITVDGGAWSSPSDFPSDQDRTKIWSDLVQGSVDISDSLPATGAFNGTIGTSYREGVRAVTTELLTINFGDAFPDPVSVEIFGYTAAVQSRQLLEINGVIDTQWTDVTGNNSQIYNLTNLQSISWEYESSTRFFYLYGIKVNGKLLTDKNADGDTQLIKETHYDTKLTLAGAKDLDDLKTGDVVKMGLAADVPYQPVSDSITKVEADTPLAGQTTLTLSDDTDLAYFRKGDVVQGTAGDPDEVKVISKDDSVPSITVDGGDWYADPANGGDGSGETDGDTEVTCVSPLKAPTDWKIEAIEGNTLSLSHATPDGNAQVWVANDNQAGTDFYVTGPSIVDDPLLTADVKLQSSLFATTPADADTLKNIVWELNGTEQNAGTSNPYKPTLAVNTTYKVRVKHQGNTLEDSPWSDQTTFTTGATRNLYTYYKERVELLEARLAGIEADEIVDDATDVTLLTAFANLVQRVEALENP